MVDNSKLFSVAFDYYELGKTKSEIAKSLGVSHVQVGKYINLAKERGVVEIVLNPPAVQKEEYERLSSLFKELYGLEHLILAPGAAKEDTAHSFIIESLISYLLNNYANECLSFGIGLGHFMSEISQSKLKVIEKRTKWKIYPILDYDIQDMKNDEYDCLSLCDLFVKNWGVSMDKKYRKIVSSYLEENITEDSVKQYYEKLDFVLGGVGVPFPRNPRLRKSLFTAEDLEALKNNEISGDYLNYYFDDSKMILKPSTQGFYSIDIDTLKSIPKRIAIASGYGKVGSISSLLKAGLANVLITDLPTARNIICLSQ